MIFPLPSFSIPVVQKALYNKRKCTAYHALHAEALLTSDSSPDGNLFGRLGAQQVCMTSLNGDSIAGIAHYIIFQYNLR
jgi:hypothetical protein